MEPQLWLVLPEGILDPILPGAEHGQQNLPQELRSAFPSGINRFGGLKRNEHLVKFGELAELGERNINDEVAQVGAFPYWNGVDHCFNRIGQRLLLRPVLLFEQEAEAFSGRRLSPLDQSNVLATIPQIDVSVMYRIHGGSMTERGMESITIAPDWQSPRRF